jgi:hypothetical protein
MELQDCPEMEVRGHLTSFSGKKDKMAFKHKTNPRFLWAFSALRRKGSVSLSEMILP